MDLSSLDLRIQCDMFQMITTVQMRILLPQGDYAISLDLIVAYGHVPVALHFSPYLDFAISRKAYASGL